MVKPEELAIRYTGRIAAQRPQTSSRNFAGRHRVDVECPRGFLAGFL
jgi:hypothetical protein